MYTKTSMQTSTEQYCSQINKLSQIIQNADAVVIGAGAGVSTAAGFTYDGERFEKNFADFIAKYHFTDMYTAGFYPFLTLEEQWAFWSRFIYINRYTDAPLPVYQELRNLIEKKDYFVVTTNVDHQFQKAGFCKERLFYTQGDYGLWQCEEPCHQKTYDNEETVIRMVKEQKDMRVPSELIPHCPICGRPMTMNLRADQTFVEDDGWHQAKEKYHDFIRRHLTSKIVYLEMGVGYNTPVIIKYPFWQMTEGNSNAWYVCLNRGEAYAPQQIEKQSLCINHDIREVLHDLQKKKA